MKSSALARKAAAFGASTAMMAGLVAGLAASPAQAATSGSAATAATAKAKVSVSKPKVSTGDYQGSCPVDVKFSSTVKVKPGKKRTTLAYRWLHADGSKSKVKTVTVKGTRTKSITVSEKATFNGDLKGWQALQVLSPRKVTSKKSYFSVSCLKLDAKKPEARVSARAWASPSRYVGACTPGTKIDIVGKIRVDRPSWVRYRWVVNGDVVDYGKVRVWDSRTVSVGVSPRHSQHGSAVLEVLSPDRTTSNRAHYKVWCKDYTPRPVPSVKVFATGMSASTDKDCKVSASASIRSTGSARVQWTWSLNGRTVSSGQGYFHGRDSKSVSLPAQALSGSAKDGGRIVLSVQGPNNSDSTGAVYAACAKPEPAVTATPVPTVKPTVTATPVPSASPVPSEVSSK
ncbi:hypothetical protein ACIBQX_34420 [Nonomuraea sp. NPDC049714]|uniref:hypothetical protein n=1 Tax=Nonomuraea sp. NPDC049714 TaxID=3364357 RepID=UPI0037BC0DFD